MRKLTFKSTVYRLLMLTLFLCSVQLTRADGWPQTLKGKVLDAVTSEPLIGVNIQIKGTTVGVISDFDGNFQLQANESSIVVFTYVGYKSLEIKATDIVKSPTILMGEDAETLEEVVVVGYGTQKKVTSVGSITQTGGETLMKGGAVNSVSEALQGKLNGVVAINSSGQPGDNNVTMYIRGKSSWDVTAPLILLDGIETDINDIDMNEIENISVLKDASATAVYGVRGGNGVILITTKRGTNKAPQINFSASYTYKAPTTSFEMADYVTAIKAYNQAQANDGSWDKLIPQSTLTAWEKAYAEGAVGPYSDMFPYVNWWDELIGSGFTQNYNVNIRGGTDFMKYFASIGYQGDGDIYKLEENEAFNPQHSYKRYNWRSNFDFDITKSTKLSISIAGKMAYRNKAHAHTNDGQLFSTLLTTPTSLYPVKYSDGEWGDDDKNNPVANMNGEGSNLRKTFQGWYDAQLEQKLDFITKGLKVKAKVSYTSASTTSTSYYLGNEAGTQANKYIIRYSRTYDYTQPSVGADGKTVYPMVTNGRLPSATQVTNPVFRHSFDALDAYDRRFYYEFALSYDRKFGDHDVSALALVNRQIYDAKSGGSIRFPSYNEDWVGRVTYNWRERYLAEANISYTGSEKFARGNRFGLFPSFSVGWRISEEPFIKNKIGEVLTNAKIRYSWGKVGSDAGASRWSYIQSFSSGGSANFGIDNSGYGWGPLYSEGNIANANSTWEKSTKQNLGIEVGLWNKFALTVDLFSEKRKDILMTPNTTSPIVGATFNELNLGETKNHGIEVEARWDDRIGNDFNYHVKFTMAASENRVVFRDDPSKTYSHLKQAGKPIGHSTRYLTVGNYGSIDDIFNYAQSNGGVNSTNANQIIAGDLVYIDFNSDGILNDQDQVAVDELNYPLITYGLDLGFEYKGWSFSAMFYAPQGVYNLVNSAFGASFVDGKINAQPDALNVWTAATANTSGIVRPSLHLKDSNGFNGVENTYRYQNFSYIRLKNLEVAYQFSKKIISPLKVSSLQLYVTGNNLLTFWDGDDRIDPEGNQTGYPILRSVTGGVRLSF